MRVPLLALSLLLTGCTSIGSASLGSATLDERDTRRLTVAALHGACDTLRRAKVEQEADRVRVTVPLTTERGDCDDLGVVTQVPVVLDEPLGERRLVADTGRPITVLGRDRCRPLEVRPLPQYVGLTESQVRERAGADGFRAVRVVCLDGRGLDRTSDDLDDRVSLNLDDGVVSGAAAF